MRENTQLWTPEGFKFLSELKEGDECYTWNNGKFRKSKIKKLNVYDYDGELIQFKGRSFQETVTPNHRVFYKVPNTQNKYNLREAKDLIGHSKLSIPICSDNDFSDYPMDDSLLRCCTFALTDGIFGLNEDGTPTKLRYAMSPNRTGLTILKEDLDKLGIGYTETKCASNMYGEVHNVTIPAVEAQIIERQLKHTKKEIPFFFKMLSQRQANIVLDAWARTDGQFVKESEAKYLQCDSMEIAEALQEVVLLAGYGSEIISRKCRRITNPKEFTEIIYVHVLARDAKRVSEYNTIHYKGKVWCPTTDDGVVVFREENMMPYISGNSIFWNVAVFDRYYFDAIFGNFYFPDGSRPDYESLRKLQYFFMEWFTEERTKSLLTFPVLTESSLNNEDGTPKDLEFAEKMAEFRANGLSFFSYNDINASALSSCCLEGNEKLKFTINGKIVEKSIKDFVQSYISDENGEIKLDEDIYVESFNTKTKEKEQSKVSGVLSKHYYGKLYKFVVNDNVITVTPDHPFTVLDKETNNLVTIDAKAVYDNKDRYLVPCNNDGIKFSDIDCAEEKETSSTTVYDIEVADTSHFIANNIVTHNCRLRNAIEKDDEDNEFAYTLGGVGVATGSTSVMTLNFNRLAQKAIRKYLKKQDPERILTRNYIHTFINSQYALAESIFMNRLEEVVKEVHKFQFAHRQIVEDYIKFGMLPVYTAGFISTKQQFCTIGISGLNECAEFMGYKVSNNNDYKNFVARVVGLLTDLNKKARKIHKIKFNTEYVPSL